MLDLKALSTPPEDLPPGPVALPTLQIGPTLLDWERQRQALRETWLDYLGHGPQPVPLEGQTHQEEDLGDVTRALVSYQVEERCRVEAYLIRPRGEGPFPGVVVFHPTSVNTILGPAGLASDPPLQFGLRLAQRGIVTLSPRNFLWSYRGMHAQDFEGYARVTGSLLERWPGWTGMGKMLWDGMRAVDFLLTIPLVDPARLGCIGHSLGAKEVLYLMAFDERVHCGVSSEGGVGIPLSNWDAPWYLGDHIHSRPDLEHHHLLALCAPRPLLVLGGGLKPPAGRDSQGDAADPIEDWAYMEAARPAYALYAAPERLCLFLHDKGHCVPPEAEQVLYPWLSHFLGAAP
jgi:dienelactone hydrolase